MIAIFDVGYFDQPDGVTAANSACVTISDWADEHPKEEICETVIGVEPYIPGEFYKRELPCILAAIEKLSKLPSIFLVDGYVYLDQNNQPGLGYYLFEHFEKAIPVIGVAKNPFRNLQYAEEVFRGQSQKPLYLTAAGISPTAAANHLQEMHGQNRVPSILKRVDQLSRGK